MPEEVEDVAVLAEAVLAEQREEVELHGERLLEHEAQPERRHGIADRLERRDDLVRPAVLPDRLQHADGDRDDDGHEQRHAGQPERGRDPGEDLVADREPVGERVAPGRVVERERPEVGEPLHELGRERLVQPVQADQVVDGLRAHPRRAELVHRRARGQVHDEERDHADPDDDRDRLEQAAKDVARHAVGSSLGSASIRSGEAGRRQTRTSGVSWLAHPGRLSHAGGSVVPPTEP